MSELDPLNPSSGNKSKFGHVHSIWNGDHLSEDGIENAVASLLLVCALILTVPYGLITSLNTDFWDNVDALAEDCPQFGYEPMAAQTYACVRICLYSSLCGKSYMFVVVDIRHISMKR